MNNEKYQIKLLCEKWFDFDLITELNEIIVKEEIKEQFLPVKTVDQSLIIVFADTFLKEQLSTGNVLEDTNKLILKKPLNFNSVKVIWHIE